MTELTLSRDEVPRLQEAMDALLSPFDYPTLDHWRTDVNRSVGDVLGADMRSFLLPVPGVEPIHSDEVSVSSLRSYQELILPLDTRLHLTERLRRLGVSSRKSTWGKHLPLFYRSNYHNEFLVPHRIFDNLTATVGVGSGPAVAQLFFNHDRPQGRRFGRRGRQLLKLLLPALKAGVQTATSLCEASAELEATLDRLPQGVVLLDRSGRIVHENPTAAALLADSRTGEGVRATVEEMVRAMYATAPGVTREAVERGLPTAASSSLSTSVGRIQLSATFVGRRLFGPARTVLVTISPEAKPTDLERRGRRLGLTNQQSRVAALLAERKTNAEVAQALGISPHTARRHTERVLAKLGIGSRRDVRRRLVDGSGE